MGRGEYTRKCRMSLRPSSSRRGLRYSLRCGFEGNRFEILGNDYFCFRRRRLNLLYERLQSVESRLLRVAIRCQEIVPMSREHDGGIVQGAHQAAAVVVDFFSRAGSADQHGVWFQPRNLAFDVVHSTKGENLMSMETDQVGEGSSL